MRIYAASLIGLWCLGAPFWALAQNYSALIRANAQGRLTYVPDSRGNVVPDFSHVGYRNGEAAIPTVPTVRTLAPISGDNRARIQAAIDAVSALPLQANGFRGALLLTAGTFRIQDSVVVRASGVVLRGQGFGSSGTVLLATRRRQHTLVQFNGAGSVSAQSSTSKRIVSNYLPTGARTFAVEPGHSFAVGDRVLQRRAPNQAWINVLGMNLLSTLDPTCVDWTPASYTIDYMRTVTAVSGNSITLDAPVVDPIDPTYATGYLLKYTWANRLENVGIENLKLDTEYSSPTDENHAWDAIDFDDTEHGWVRNIEAWHFGFAAVRILRTSAFISVINSKCLDGISLIQGERRYSFCIEGQRNLVMGCFTRNGRHDFVTGARVAGPNTFVRCTGTRMLNIAGPHHRWATGTLYDNLVCDGPLNVENRVTSGTGHGWAGAQNMIWNSTAATVVIQSPPQHINWAVGCRANVTGVGNFFTGVGYSESTGTFVAPQSLYDKQLCDRLGGAACTALAAAESFAAEEQLIIYPNPARKKTVTVYFPGGPGKLSLLDTTGRVILEQASFVPGPLEVGKLADGTYLLRVAMANGKVFTRRLLRQ